MNGTSPLVEAIVGARRGTLAVLVFAIATLALLHITVTWFLPDVPRWLWRYVHLDREQNLPTWFSSLQLALLGLLFAGASLLEGAAGAGRLRRLGWLVLCGGALFLSLDEQTGLHEAIGTLVGDVTNAAKPGTFRRTVNSFPSYYWAIVYVPLALPAGFFAGRFLWRELAGDRKRVFVAMCLYVTGALVLDHIEGRYGTSGHDWLALRAGGVTLWLDVVLVEELFELLGVALLVAAMFDRLERLAGAEE